MTTDHQVELRSGEFIVSLKDVELPAILRIPDKAKGVVVFAHGSGSSRLSPRNRFVANYLYQRKMGTLLFDLLTEEEEEHDLKVGAYRFDIPFLTERLMFITDWLAEEIKAQKKDWAVGLFGASTGAAAAIEVAAQRPEIVNAVVSRGGRPDLAVDHLPQMNVPVLLIVGGRDVGVLRLNFEAYQKITAEKQFHIVQNATHLFEEPGALEEVAKAAAQWFDKYFTPKG